MGRFPWNLIWMSFHCRSISLYTIYVPVISNTSSRLNYTGSSETCSRQFVRLFEIYGHFVRFSSKQASVSRKNNCFGWRVFDLPQSWGRAPPPHPSHPRPASDIWRVVGSTCGQVIYASNYRSGSGMLPHGVSCHGYWDWLLLARNGFALSWFSSLCLLLYNWYMCRVLTVCLCPCNV
jgi:hypothetical protein